MDLPERPRVIYAYNPLNEVICQLRFPPILKIPNQQPYEFQEAIREKYPFFEDSHSQLPSDFAKVIQQIGLPFSSEVSYSFRSEDEKWQLSLTKEFITLLTYDYQKYEDFKIRFQEVMDIFERIYKPSFYTRIGLRYRDLIVRSELNLKDKDWSELISQDIASELHHPLLSKSVKNVVKELLFDTEEGLINLKHGLVNVQNKEENKEEICYLIDADFSTEKKVGKHDQIWNILNYFNKLARNLFRFSITDTLHNAMQPKEFGS